LSGLPISELILEIAKQNIYIALLVALFIWWIIDSKKREKMTDETYRMLADKFQKLNDSAIDLKVNIDQIKAQNDCIDENVDKINEIVNGDIKLTLNTMQTIINERLKR